MGAKAQQFDRPKRIGILHSYALDDPQQQADRKAFVQALAQLGLIEGRDVTLDVRGAAGSSILFHKYAAELIALTPDVIVANSPLAVFAVQNQINKVPIVFFSVGDPVAYGLIASMARPGGNVTGVANFGFAMGGKWIEVLKEMAPSIERAAFLYHLATTTKGYEEYLRSVVSAAPNFGVTVKEILLRDETEIEPLLSDFARTPNGGLIFPPDPFTTVHRNEIVRLAALLRLPAIYPFRQFVESGGLISYGVDRLEQIQKVAAFVNRILRGEKPADLPAEGPTKFELTINTRTAKAMGLTVPPTLLARADEVIE